MKANEIRIGNLFTTIIPIEGSWMEKQKYDKEIYQVNSCTFQDDRFEYFKGLPLTEEWLLKLNAKSTELNPAKNGVWITCEVDNQGCWVCISHGTGVVVMKLDYVHQLQNLYFALTAEELNL